MIWGNVVDAENPSQQIAISSASWTVTDGTKTASYTGSTKPPVRIVSLGGESYFVLEVPFDTRQLGTAVLADPITQGIDSFELKPSSPPTYTLAPTINGVLATVRAIDGAPASGDAFPVNGFTTTARGRVIRVDLAIVVPVNDYDSWADSFFGAGNPEGARDADPDGDGLINEHEHQAGTDPTDPNSVLRILTVSTGDLDTRIGWRSVNGRGYVIEAANDPAGPWVDISSPIAGAADNTEAVIDRNGAEPWEFYRVRVNVP